MSASPATPPPPPESSSAKGPLAGIRVLDLSDTFMAPYTSLTLAQMGAQVVKVELPSGDVTRQIGDVTGLGMGPIFMNANRGKQSIVLDIRLEEDYEVFAALAARSDVVLHNRRPSAQSRLRIDYDTLSKLNQRLIYCSTVGFGSTGPYADRAAYDDVIQAASGLAAVQTGAGAPAYVRSPVADKTTGLMAVGAIAAALYERERSGQGQAIEVPMFETIVSFLLLEQQSGRVYDPPRGPTGYSRTDSIYRRPYRTTDGLIGVLVYTDAQWQAFFDLIGRLDLAADARFASMRARSENIDVLYSFVESQLMGRSTAEWETLLEARGIPVSRVNTIDDLFGDEHLREVGFFQGEDHPIVGRILTSRLPVTFSRTETGPVVPAPGLDEHAAAVRSLLDDR